jgi:internalin A
MSRGTPIPALYSIFVRMMERFQLCYQLEPERPGLPVSQSLIPQLLPEQPPGALPAVPTVPAAGQVLLELRYALSFVPAGLISWLLVRTHRYSQRQHWREGARLTYDGQQAQIALDSQQREITLSVWGPFPYTFLLILKQTLDDLLQTFHGLKVQRSIPCRCQVQPQAPHAHSYEDLKRRLARGEREIICAEGARLPLTTLLYGLHASTLPQMEATVQKTQQAISEQLATTQQSQGVTEEVLRLLTRLDQEREYVVRTLFTLDRRSKKQERLEQEKLSNVCPGLFVLERPPRRPLNPRDWVSRAYRLRLLCQYPQGPHLVPGEEGYEVRQGQEWWNAMSPWLRVMVKLLEIGLPQGKALNEGFKLVDIERFAPQIEVFQEVLAGLPEIEASDDLKDARLGAPGQTLQRLEGAPLEALHTFLKGHPPPWQGLTQVPAEDGTLWWVCDHHRQVFEAPLITV